LQAVAILAALYFLGRFTGLIQSVAISALLPPTATDAYSAAFDLPDSLNYLVAGGAISATFIPLFTRMWDRGQDEDAWRFFSTVASIMGLVLIILTVLMMIFTPQLTLLTKPGMGAPNKAETLRLAVAMTRIILPAQLFFYLGGLLVGVLNTFKRFGASGWTGPLYNFIAVGIAIPLFLITRNPLVFAWGILLGAFGGNFLLPLLAAGSGPRKQRVRFQFHLSLQDPAVRRFFWLALPIMFGVSVPVVDQWVVNYFASSLNSGALTHIRNGSRLMIAVQGVLGQAAAVAAFPYMASLVATDDFRKFSDIVQRGLKRLLFVTVPISVLMLIWAEPLVRIIFGWGEYNRAVPIQETAAAFAFFCVGLFAWAGQGFVARAFYALGDTVTPTVIGSAITIFFFCPLCWAAMRFHTGVVGLALATTLGASAYFVAISLALEKLMKKRRYRAPLRLERICGTLLRTLAAAFIMGIVGLVALRLGNRFMATDKVGDIGLMLWSGFFAYMAFAWAARAFKIPEWFWIHDKIGRHLPGRKKPSAAAD
jgi:putative peptidoglycan lipid II flippase